MDYTWVIIREICIQLPSRAAAKSLDVNNEPYQAILDP